MQTGWHSRETNRGFLLCCPFPQLPWSLGGHRMWLLPVLYKTRDFSNFCGCGFSRILWRGQKARSWRDLGRMNTAWQRLPLEGTSSCSSWKSSDSQQRKKSGRLASETQPVEVAPREWVPLSGVGSLTKSTRQKARLQISNERSLSAWLEQPPCEQLEMQRPVISGRWINLESEPGV